MTDGITASPGEGPGAFWTEGAVSCTVTPEQIRASADAIRSHREPDPCSLGRHVVSPRALMRPGLYMCVNCLHPITIPYPLSEHVYPSPGEAVSP